jgi:putative GTP pyrophosphokinase
MNEEASKSEIDRLGDRLRKGTVDESDSRLLDRYRLSFVDAYEIVVGTVRDELGLEPTGRPAKSTTSIAEKLRRESIRLTQIQDIAGCRLVIFDAVAQNRVVEALSRVFPTAIIVDRREKPSHGYRAVHVIAKLAGKSVEIQVRTALQHLWAELSEKYSDVVDPAIKYGGGSSSVQVILRGTSNLIGECESLQEGLPGELKQVYDEVQTDLRRLMTGIIEGLKRRK